MCRLAHTMRKRGGRNETEKIYIIVTDNGRFSDIWKIQCTGRNDIGKSVYESVL